MYKPSPGLGELACQHPRVDGGAVLRWRPPAGAAGAGTRARANPFSSRALLMFVVGRVVVARGTACGGRAEHRQPVSRRHPGPKNLATERETPRFGSGMRRRRNLELRKEEAKEDSKKKSSSKWLRNTLILLVLAGGGYAAMQAGGDADLPEGPFPMSSSAYLSWSSSICLSRSR